MGGFDFSTHFSRGRGLQKHMYFPQFKFYDAFMRSCEALNGNSVKPGRNVPIVVGKFHGKPKK